MFGPGNNSASQSVVTYGLAFDALFGAAGRDIVQPYVGIGGSYVFLRSTNPTATGHEVGGTAFVGVRVRIVPRVHLYGEVGVDFVATRSAFQAWTDRLSLSTTPLGLMVYLN